jgi:protein-S-isoprenylcysteine O-methyltransferase Ste14
MKEAEWKRCLCSYGASMAVILAGVYFYTALSPYYIALYRLSWRPMLAGHVSPVTIDLALALWFFTAVYVVALPPYYAVRRGLYRSIRHPAYLFKNLAWWTGALPLLIGQAKTSAQSFFWTAFCIGGWSALYLLRALCEERHLSRHADYREYLKQVPYRFIPRVF